MFGGHTPMTEEELKIRWKYLQFSDKGGYTLQDVEEYKKLKKELYGVAPPKPKDDKAQPKDE